MARVLLDGWPVSTTENAEWAIEAGVRPVKREFAVPNDPQILSDLESKALAHTPIELRMGSGPDDVVFQNLFITNILPGQDPGDARIEVQDSRVWWPYIHIRRNFNTIRRTGFRRRESWNEVLAPQQQLALPTYKYAEFSLKNRVDPYGPTTATEDIFEEIQAYFQTNFGFPAAFDLSGVAAADEIPFQSLELDATADSAIGQLFGYLPEFQPYQDYDGTIRVLNKRTGAEQETYKSLLPEDADSGHIAWVTNAIMRPRAIEVLWTAEVEVRHDFEEPDNRTGDATVVLDDLGRFLENVIPIPDFQLTVSGRPETTGTYVTFDAYLNAINDDPADNLVAGSTVGNLTDVNYELLRKATVPSNGLLWAGAQIAGSVDLSDKTADWAIRLSALQQHWRRTLRINRIWMDNTLSLKPYLVATLDPASGQRAPAIVFSDYVVDPSDKGLNYLIAADPYGRLDRFQEISGYQATINASSRFAPAVVNVVDDDQGIIHIDWQSDPYGLQDRVIPGTLKAGTNPTVQMSNGILFSVANNAVPGNATGPVIEVPQLDTGYKAAVILTHVPAYPNNNGQFVRKRVSQGDVEKFLGGSIGPQGTGPVMQIRINPGIETARVAWDDNRAEDIERLFGVKEGTADLTGLVVNAEDGTQVAPEPSQAANIDLLSLAVGAQIYAGLIDRLLGEAAGHLSALPLQGWAETITHSVDPQGVALTSVDMPEVLPERNFLQELPQSVRTLVLKLAQVPK
jgi:hypothetical protein